jgi:hypothetical protein
METAESLGVVMEHVRAELSLAEYQLDRLEDTALSLDNPELEHDLRSIAGNIRKSIDGIRDELEPAEVYGLEF